MSIVPFDRIVDQLAGAILVIDPDTHLIYANQAAVQLLALGLDRISESRPTQTRFVDLLLPRERGRWNEVRELAGRGSPARDQRFEFTGLDGVQRTGNVDVADLGDGYAALCVHGCDNDSRVAQSEQRYRTLFEQANDAVFLESFDGRIIDVNRRACQMLGYERDELLAIRIDEIAPPEALAEVQSSLDDILTTGGACLESVNVRKDGSEVPVEVSLRVLQQEGEPLMLAIVRDISERRRLERERQRMEEHLLHAQRAESLGTLSAGLAHHFNNALHGILGFAELAQQQLGPTDPVHAMIGRVIQSSQSATALTQQLLAYAGEGHLEQEPIDLNQLARDLEVMARSSVSRKVELVQELDEAVPPVRGNPSQMRQLLLNLLLNAGEACGAASGAVTVRTLSATLGPDDDSALLVPGDPPEGPCVALEVEDTGCGMDGETAARAFDPFFSSKQPGRGLGLAAVYGIVKNHGGAIDLRSEPGAGTTIRVLLPAEEPLQPAAGTGGDALSCGTETILFVDDEPMMRAYAASALSSLGYKVLLGSDGAEGLERFLAHRDAIDLVIIDAIMPRLGGAELLAELRRLDPGVRVILSSGYTEMDTTRGIEDEGLAGFLQKPYTLETLARKVRAAIDSP